MQARLFIGCLSLLLCTCGWTAQPGLDAGSGADVVGEPSVEIGGANLDGIGFALWHGTDPHPNIISGPQGGQHIWVSAHTRNLWYNKLSLTVEMRDDATGDIIAPGEVTRMVTLSRDVTFDRYEGLTAFLSSPCAVADHKIRIKLTAADLYGVATSDTAVVTPVWSQPCAP